MIFEAEYDYDYEADSLFLFKKEDYAYDITYDLDDNIVVDFDDNQHPVAFEIFNASRLFGISKHALQNIKSIRAKISINNLEIHFCIEIKVNIHNKAVEKDVNRVTSNLSMIPDYSSELATA